MRKTVAITAYDVDPYKGSESTTGWNFPYYISKLGDFDITVFTRENNKDNIDKFFNENPDLKLSNLNFEYYDLERKYRFWKKGSRGSSLYYYLWQFFVVRKIQEVGVFDIYHALNFHTDSFPSFLWRCKGKFVWGPISHHEKIPLKFMRNYSKIELVKDRVRFGIKYLLWNFDPFLKASISKSDLIIAGHSQVTKRLKLDGNKTVLLNQVANDIDSEYHFKKNDVFKFISIGRLVPLKGFDLTILSFIKLNDMLEKSGCNRQVELTIIGDGSYLDKLRELASSLDNVLFTGWISKYDVKKHLGQSDAFIFPSHEGAGMVVAEAAAERLPVIALDNYGPGELLPLDYPLKVDPLNSFETVVELLAQSMYDIVVDENNYEIVSQQTFSHYLNNFTWESKAKAILGLYDDLLKNNS